MSLNFYQTIPLRLNPIAFQIGTFSIRWYSLGYLMAFLTVLSLIFWRINKKEFDSKKLPESQAKEIILDIFFACSFGMMIGARIGYFVFYDWKTLFGNFQEVFIPGIDGFFGFSFHGGLIGAILGAWIYCKIKKISLTAIGNLIIPALPLGLFWGRIGNFLNGELFGHPTTKPWGMYFSKNSQILRHPSQIYEAFGEGAIIFIVLWSIRNKPQFQNNFLSLFLILYGSIRFFIEFFRVSPPENMILDIITTGQVLCLGMIAFGIYLFQKNNQ